MQINGNRGADLLHGGAGADSFVFNNTLGVDNVDSIMDFSIADDTIHLSRTTVFTAFNSTGVLAPARFHIGTEAATIDHFIIYDATNGTLYYDSDGTGAVAQVTFAQIDPNLALTHADFLVI